MSLTPLVLAAGRGTRFGDGSKLLADLGGTAVLARVFDCLVEVGLGGGFVALPDDDRRSALLRCVPSGFEPVFLPQDVIGMGRSLAAMADRVAPGNAALMVMGDQPLLAVEDMGRLVACAGNDRIARLTHQGKAGHPVLFPAHFIPDLVALSGDEGPQDLLKQHGYEPIEVGDPLVLCDVDTPEALQRLRAHV